MSVDWMVGMKADSKVGLSVAKMAAQKASMKVVSWADVLVVL